MDGVNASYKDLCNVCSNIRGRRADKAQEFLKEAAEGERPVRYFNYNKHRGHLRELGGKKGGWPVKSCKIVLSVLENAIANARSKGMGECKIAHIEANKQEIYGRMSPKGRRIRQDLETAFVEIVLKELQIPPSGKEKKKAGEKSQKEKPKTEEKPQIAKKEEGSSQKEKPKTEENMQIAKKAEEKSQKENLQTAKKEIQVVKKEEIGLVEQKEKSQAMQETKNMEQKSQITQPAKNVQTV